MRQTDSTSDPPPFDYKTEKSYNQRLQEAESIRRKYPKRVPCIVGPAPKSRVSDIPQHKFLVQDNLTLGQFYYTIRKKIQLRADQALFFFCNDTIPSTSCTIGELYSEFCDDDKFLYLTYSDENTYG